MPQMAPMMWLNILIIIMFMLLTVMSLIYFSADQKNDSQLKENITILNKKLSW